MNDDLHFMMPAFTRHNLVHNNVKLVAWNDWMV